MTFETDREDTHILAANALLVRRDPLGSLVQVQYHRTSESARRLSGGPESITFCHCMLILGKQHVLVHSKIVHDSKTR